MVVATSGPDPYDEGYPRSLEADLDPTPGQSQSLDDADREASNEQRVVLEDRRPDGSTDDEGRFEDTGDAESRH
jgi:hypothetical protein